MTAIQALLLGAVIGGAGLVLLVWAAPRRHSVLDRLETEPSAPIALGEDETGGPVSLDRLVLNQPFTERFLNPSLNALGRIVLRRLPSQDIVALRELIELAGRPSGTTPELIIAMQVVFAIGLGILAIWLDGIANFDVPINFMFVFVAGLMGFTLPRTSLKRRVKKRKADLTRSLPDMVDLLTVSVEAGLTFEAALRKVVEKFQNDLSFEFQKALNEYRLGLPLNTALKQMADRLQVPSLASVVRVVLQSEQLGTSLGQILRIQSEQLRRERRARAQELGQKAPVKMLLPMVGCIFPTIFIMLLGPAIVKIVSNH